MKLTLVKKTEVATGTTSFSFKTTKTFSFEAGQYIYITLPKLNYPDERGETRHFTISSSPTESEYITVTTRIREESGYKKTLNEMPIGSVVEARGPHGTFILPIHSSQFTVHCFLAGGIGITPFRSMIKYNVDKKLGIPMYLIYSNSDSEFVFKNELDKWQEENKNIKIEFVDTSAIGHIDKLKILKFIANWKLTTKSGSLFENCAFSVIGPNTFVNAMEEILTKLQIPEDNIKSEKFTGY